MEERVRGHGNKWTHLLYGDWAAPAHPTSKSIKMTKIPVALWYLGPFPEFYYSVHHCWNSLGVLHSHALELWHSYLVYGKINTHINFRKGFFLLNQVVTWRFFPNMKNRLSIKCWIGALKRNPESNTIGWQVGMWWALMWHHFLDIERGTGPQEG